MIGALLWWTGLIVWLGVALCAGSFAYSMIRFGIDALRFTRRVAARNVEQRDKPWLEWVRWQWKFFWWAARETPDSIGVHVYRPEFDGVEMTGEDVWETVWWPGYEKDGSDEYEAIAG